MTRPGAFAIMALLSAGLLVAAADEPLADARKLEQTVQQAIAKAEPAIACLLVYRGSTPADRRRKTSFSISCSSSSGSLKPEWPNTLMPLS